MLVDLEPVGDSDELRRMYSTTPCHEYADLELTV